jgi:tetratricopeptide (TPR) repeat protein
LEFLPRGAKIRIEGKDISLTKREIDGIHDYFEILTERKIQTEIKNKDDFFRGMISNYSYYREDIDFKREVYVKPKTVDGKIIRQSLKDRIFSELQKKDLNENCVILVKGLPGVGKSVLLRRLAYDVYSSGKAPVLLFDKTRFHFDLKYLSSTLVMLDRKFDNACKPGEAHRLKSLLIIDDVTCDPLMVKDYLTSRGRLVTVVTAARENELSDRNFTIPPENVYTVEEYLSPNEKENIKEHLFKLGIIDAPKMDWTYLFDKEFKDSFFATMYMLVNPSRKPLNQIIQDQYIHLPRKVRKAFSYICAFHQFDLPINLELLVRALQCGYDEFYSEIIPASKGIIFEECEKDFLLFLTHHRIIARKTTEFFFSTTASQKNLFLDLFSNVNLRNSKERDLIQKLMIRHLASTSRSTDLTIEQKIEIFKKIISQYETKGLLHHLGVLLTDKGDHLRAEKILKKALINRNKVKTSFRSELDQNILTSLGNLYSRMALADLKENDKKAEQEFNLAERYFLRARFGGFPNAHSYHAHANMYLKKGDILSDDLEKVNAYATALDILQTARDNLNEEQLQLIYELEILVFRKVGDTEKGLQNAIKIADEFNSARGYTLFANVLRKESRRFRSWGQREPLLMRALSVVEKACERFPNDEYCLRLRCKLIKELHPLDTELQYNYLKAWYKKAQSPNIWLLFELAVAAFKSEEYEYSRRIFQKLENENISGGIKRRFRELPYTGNYRRPLKFVGIILSIENRYDGYVRCDTLRNLHYPLHFRPIACKFQPAEGDMVEFIIVFDFLGPRAVRLNRI